MTAPTPPRRARSRTEERPARSGGGSDSQFENLHARDEGGKFTAGADSNRGPAEDEPAEGHDGPKVAGLQELLRELGYDDGLRADGKMGPATVAALRRAQANLGVEGEDGFLGPKTRAALRAERDLVTGPAKPPRRARSRTAGADDADWERRTRPDEKPKPRAARRGAGTSRRARSRSAGPDDPKRVEEDARRHAAELGITDPAEVERLVATVLAARRGD